MSENIVHIEDIFTPTFEDIKARRHRGKDLSIKSLPSLDKKLWGFSKQKLNIVAARPSNGKSTFLMQLALDFAFQGKKVVMFSLEMTNKVFVERVIANQCEIDNSLLYNGFIVDNMIAYEEPIKNLTERLANINLILVESMGKTFAQIFQIIESLGEDIDCVLVDYVQMIKSDRQAKKDAIDEYIKKLREYAIKKSFCAVVASQINRGTHEGGKTKPPRLWELKGSGDLEEHSDMVIILHYPAHYSHSKYDDDTKFFITIAKNRDGRTGSIECDFFGKYYKIREKGYEQITDNHETDPFEGIYTDSQTMHPDGTENAGNFE